MSAEQLPEHVVEQMAREMTELVKPLYPKKPIDVLLAENRKAILEKPSTLLIDDDSSWPEVFRRRVYIRIPVAWYDLGSKRAAVGTVTDPILGTICWFVEKEVPRASYQPPDDPDSPFSWHT